jgi:hypothetical protein
VQVWGKDVSIFVDGPVLNDLFSGLPDPDDLTETAVKEIDLKVEGPSLHVLVEIVEIGIVVHIFILCLPAIILREKTGQRGFTRPNVSSNGYMHVSSF